MRYDPETQTLYSQNKPPPKIGLPKVIVPPRPVIGPGDIATPNDLPELVSGEWVLEWTITKKSVEEARADFRRAVKAERDRRLAADFAFMGKLYQRDPASLSRITGAATLAGFAMGAGAQPGDYRWHGGSSDFAWIASDDSLTLMDAQTAFAFGQLAANVETRIIFAAKALREMNPIPADYTDDRYWPDTTTP